MWRQLIKCGGVKSRKKKLGGFWKSRKTLFLKDFNVNDPRLTSTRLSYENFLSPRFSVSNIRSNFLFSDYFVRQILIIRLSHHICFKTFHFQLFWLHVFRLLSITELIWVLFDYYVNIWSVCQIKCHNLQKISIQTSTFQNDCETYSVVII